jgi:hypothetical protein
MLDRPTMMMSTSMTPLKSSQRVPDPPVSPPPREPSPEIPQQPSTEAPAPIAEVVAAPAKAKPKRPSKAQDEDDDDDDRDDDDEGDNDDDEDEGARSARARERGRIAAILNSEIGKKRPRAALALALKSRQSRNEVIASLEALDSEIEGERLVAIPPPPRLSERMAEQPPANTLESPRQAGTSVAEMIILAGKKRRGEI